MHTHVCVRGRVRVVMIQHNLLMAISVFQVTIKTTHNTHTHTQKKKK